MQCVASCLECKIEVLNEESGQDDMETWDSMNHLKILICIEAKFKFQFTEDDFLFCRNISDLATKVEENIG